MLRIHVVDLLLIPVYASWRSWVCFSFPVMLILLLLTTGNTDS